MRARLGLGKQTNTWHATARGWLYRHDWHLAGLLAIAIIAIAGFLLWPRPLPVAVAPAVISANDVEAAQEKTVIVYVAGAVRNPGLYTLLATLRVSDAIVAAGGLTENADPACQPNLAAHLKDSMQVVVPQAGHCAKAKKAKLDINLATREQLLHVPGMDGVLADAIIRYRQDYGSFTALTELKSAMGLDAATYKQLARTLTVP
ncbi:MAG TPA: ComEA family DNA-binding protein [Candidatus Dormibacteraeota bacterium]|nr:ComEA family DNA-binding protein [Candidatus Dormibacteraeota bacterium]